jgi:hypothetical protein
VTVLPRVTPRRAVHVGQGEQAGQSGLVRVVADARDLDQNSIGQGRTHELRLAAVGAAGGPEAAADTGGLEAGVAELAGAAGPGEGRDEEVALAQGGDLATDFLDDADELVAHRYAGRVGGHGVVGVQVTAAHAGADDAHQRVGGVLDRGLGNVDDADVAGAVHVGGSHAIESTRPPQPGP